MFPSLLSFSMSAPSLSFLHVPTPPFRRPSSFRPLLAALGRLLPCFGSLLAEAHTPCLLNGRTFPPRESNKPTETRSTDERTHTHAGLASHFPPLHPRIILLSVTPATPARALSQLPSLLPPLPSHPSSQNTATRAVFPVCLPLLYLVSCPHSLPPSLATFKRRRFALRDNTKTTPRLRQEPELLSLLRTPFSARPSCRPSDILFSPVLRLSLVLALSLSFFISLLVV